MQKRQFNHNYKKTNNYICCPFIQIYFKWFQLNELNMKFTGNLPDTILILNTDQNLQMLLLYEEGCLIKSVHSAGESSFYEK